MEPIDLEWLNEEQNEIMNDLMQSELAGIEEILEDPSHSVRVAYNELRDPRREHMEVEDALGFTYLIKDDAEYDIMEALEKLYKSGLSLAKIKKAMKEWQEEFFTDRFGNPIDTSMGIGFDEYTEFIIAKRKQIEVQDLEAFMKKKRLGALDEIEKRVNFHIEWGFTMDIVGKFEKKNKAVTAIQSRHRGNNVREMLEKKGILYRDWTSHWKNKNKESIRAELVKVMIDEDMSGARKAEVMEEIEQFMTEKLMAGKKKTRRRRGKKKSRGKKSKTKKKARKKRSRYTKKSK